MPVEVVPASHSLLARLVIDQPVELTAGARDDRDRYGRILRYIDVLGIDAGGRLLMIDVAKDRKSRRLQIVTGWFTELTAKLAEAE